MNEREQLVADLKSLSHSMKTTHLGVSAGYIDRAIAALSTAASAVVNEREMFEREYPPPHKLTWNEQENSYWPSDGFRDIPINRAIPLQNARWEAWQARAKVGVK